MMSTFFSSFIKIMIYNLVVAERWGVAMVIVRREGINKGTGKWVEVKRGG